MAPIPVKCLNPKCRTLFFANNIVGGTGGQIQFTNCGFSPCPACGGACEIMDGVYKIVQDKLFATIQKFDDFLILQKVLTTIQKELSRTKSPKNIKKKLKKKFPEQKSIWNLIPETKQDAQFIIMAILAIISIILNMGSCQSKDKETILTRAFESLSSQERPLSPKNNPLNSRNALMTKPSKLIDI